MAHGNVHVITDMKFWEEKLGEADTHNKVVVIDFTASWCGPCKFISPHFEELSKRFPNLIYLQVDVDHMTAISAQYEVRAMPTFVFLEKRQVVDKMVGANKSELEAKVKHHSEKCAAVPA